MDSAKGKSTVRGKEKLVAALLMVLFVTPIVGYLWWGRFEYHKSLLLLMTYGGTIGIVLVSHLYFRDSRQKLGLRLDNFAEALRVAAVPNILLLAIILIWGVGTARFSAAWSDTTLLYLPWAFLQQYVLQNFLLARSGTVLGRNTAALLVASLIFALIHLPNAALVFASLVGALVWCRVFLQVPNLFVVTLSHATLGIMLVIFFKFSGLDQLQVGKPGYAYRTLGDGVLVAGGYDASGNPFVATLPGHDQGNPSLVRVFEPNGAFRSEWVAYPDYDFSGNLAVGDVGFNEGDEIVVAPGPGIRNLPEIRVFDTSGRKLTSFCLQEYPGYGATVSIAGSRILVCPGPGPERPAIVFEYLPDGSLIKKWDLGDIGFHNSVRAQRIEVLDQAGRSRFPKLLLWASDLSVNSSDIIVYDERTATFSTWGTYGTAFGLNLTTIRLGKERTGLLTGPGSAPGHGPRIKIFDESGIELKDLFAYQDESSCGTHVASLDLDGDSVDEIVLGEGICPGQPSTVRIVDREGTLLSRWDAY